MGKYRQIGEKTNAKCEKCGIDIWVPDGVFTCYHGYQSWADYPTVNPECVIVMKDDFEVQGPVCWSCFEKMEEKVKSGVSGS